MTTIDDSNTHDSSDTPPYFWFGEISARLRARTRDELHELDLGRRGWRVLHTLADGPATADELSASLPHRGRRGGRPFGGRPGDGGRPTEADSRPEGDASSGEQAHAAARPREWRGRPDWMRREWERRQQMYRAWMEHDSSRAQGGPDHHDDHAHDSYGPEDHGHDSQGHEHDHGHDDHEHDKHDHDHEHNHDERNHGREHHHPHPDHHGAEQAFERGFERGFLRGVERGGPFGHGARGFGPGGFGYGGFGPGRYGRGFGPGSFGAGAFGPGRFGPDGWGHEHGQGRPFAGRYGFEGRCRGGVDRILADFVERGWVWFDGDRATLTEEGRAAHDAARARVTAVRATVTEGIEPADLATTLATLEAMARNLGWTPRAEAADAAAPATEGATNNGTDEDTGTDRGTGTDEASDADRGTGTGADGATDAD